MITSEKKASVLQANQRHAKDTGSPEAQVGILTERIKELTDHLKLHKQDNHSRRGLLQMVGRRKRLLRYLKDRDFGSHQALLKKLGLRG